MVIRRISLAAALAVLLLVIAVSPSARAVGDVSPEAMNALRLFTRALAIVEMQYVEEVNVKDLVYGAIGGMVSSLDPHSGFLTPDQFKMLTDDTRGEFGGLGIEISTKDGYVAVVSPIDDTPAARAGLQAGDLIVKIEGKLTKGMGLDAAVDMLRGKPGTTITITIWRDGLDKPFDVTLERAIIKVVSVRQKTLEPGIGYVRISKFSGETTDGLHKAIAELKAQPGGLKGLVLDLRNNPGGLLDEAVKVSDEFLDKGLVVYTAGRVQTQNMTFSSKPGGDYLDGPMVVLVNGASASASEIVAGALKDRARALVLGTRTFGKASVQTIMPIDDGVALRLTTAKYFTPNGTDIQAKGIEPMLWIRTDGGEGPENDDDTFSEADYPNRLKNVDEPSVPGNNHNGLPETPGQEPEPEEPAAPKPPDGIDHQLNKAIEVLKSWDSYKTALRS